MKIDYVKRLALTLAGIGLAATAVIGTIAVASDDGVPVVKSADIPFDPFGRPEAARVRPDQAERSLPVIEVTGQDSSSQGIVQSAKPVETTQPKSARDLDISIEPLPVVLASHQEVTEVAVERATEFPTTNHPALAAKESRIAVAQTETPKPVQPIVIQPIEAAAREREVASNDRTSSFRPAPVNSTTLPIVEVPVKPQSAPIVSDRTKMPAFPGARQNTPVIQPAAIPASEPQVAIDRSDALPIVQAKDIPNPFETQPAKVASDAAAKSGTDRMRRPSAADAVVVESTTPRDLSPKPVVVASPFNRMKDESRQQDGDSIASQADVEQVPTSRRPFQSKPESEPSTNRPVVFAATRATEAIEPSTVTPAASLAIAPQPKLEQLPPVSQAAPATKPVQPIIQPYPIQNEPHVRPSDSSADEGLAADARMNDRETSVRQAGTTDSVPLSDPAGRTESPTLAEIPTGSELEEALPGSKELPSPLVLETPSTADAEAQMLSESNESAGEQSRVAQTSEPSPASVESTDQSQPLRDPIASTPSTEPEPELQTTTSRRQEADTEKEAVASNSDTQPIPADSPRVADNQWLKGDSVASESFVDLKDDALDAYRDSSSRPNRLPGLPVTGAIPPLTQDSLMNSQEMIVAEDEIILDGQIDPLTASMPYVSDCCRGCPDRTYVVAEGLVFRREGERTQLSSGFKLNGFDYKEGLRVTIGRRSDCLNGWEATYMGLEPWYTYDNASSPGGDLQPGFFAGPGFTASDIGTYYNSNYHEQLYRSELHSFEVNRTHWGWDVITTSVGLRYMVLNEDMRFTALKGNDRADLNIETNNHLIGGQLGSELFFDVGNRFYFSSKFRGGIYANINDGGVNYTNTGPTASNSFFFNSSQGLAFAATGDLNVTGYFKLTPNSRIRAGYEFWYLYGVATAKGNTSRQVGPSMGLNIDDRDDLLIHGLSIGFEFVR